MTKREARRVAFQRIEDGIVEEESSPRSQTAEHPRFREMLGEAGVEDVEAFSAASPFDISGPRKSWPQILDDLAREEMVTDDAKGKVAELYESFPKLKTGDWHILVERTSPSTYHNQPCGGWQDKILEPITIAEFVDRYGGGEYTLHVWRPGRRVFPPRVVATLDLAIPGPPVIKRRS